MSQWSIEDAKKNYNIFEWGEGYFSIDSDGQITVQPMQNQPPVALNALISDIRDNNLSFPILLRFPDILRQRVIDLSTVFNKTMNKMNYGGKFLPIYPIKVNQHKHVVETLLSTNQIVGLEVGSKPEFMIVLGSVKDSDLIICNGYKDNAYIRLALIAKAIGRRVYLIVEKLSEVQKIINLSKEMQIEPLIGVRIRLSTLGEGKWQNTGGAKAKFGLTSHQVLELVSILKNAGLISSLKLLHFHMGSQLSNIRSIKQGMREGARFFVELKKLGVPLDTIDVGGGLGVDYEGSGTRGFCSKNYSLSEYAYHVIHSLVECCKQANVKEPDIITETGRALTAHHAVLLHEIIDNENKAVDNKNLHIDADSPLVLTKLKNLDKELHNHSPVEIYQEVSYWLEEVNSLFVNGVLTLSERAVAEQLSISILVEIHKKLRPELIAHRDIYDDISNKLANKLFANFSVFQSVPDVWGIDQIFPVLPIEGLNVQPKDRYVLADITCDSDGCFKNYIDGQSIADTCLLPESVSQKGSILGIFLVGAYQEVLGDNHNLFGKTHVVEFQYIEGKYQLNHMKKGNTISDVITEIGFDKELILNACENQINQSTIPKEDKEKFQKELKEALDQYTYLTNKNDYDEK